MFKRNKFRAIRTEIDGVKFPSLLESRVYLFLKNKVELGELSDLQCQVEVIFFQDPKISLRVDFSAVRNGELIFIEAKGQETIDFKIKKKLWHHRTNSLLEVYKSRGTQIILVESIKGVHSGTLIKQRRDDTNMAKKKIAKKKPAKKMK